MENSIRKAFNKLNEDEKQALRLISILCTDFDGASIRTLCNIIGSEPHVFQKEVITLENTGLLAIQVNTIFLPTGVAFVVDNIPIKNDRLNGYVSRLHLATTLSIKDDLLCVRPYFTMAMSIMKYVLDHPDVDINFEEFGKLLVNITRHYEIFAEPLPIHGEKDLALVQALELVQSRIEEKSTLCSAMSTCHAFILLNGFHYSESRLLLDEAVSVAHDNNDSLAWCYFVNALWWENYGVIARCLEFAYKSWEIAAESLKDYVAVYIGYQLALLEEYDASDDWVNKININKYPQHHAVRVYYYLSMAMKCNDEILVEDHLMRAECLLNHINHQAPLKACVFYVRHNIYCKWGINKEACNQYHLYANLLAIQYRSTEGAMYIYATAEVNRLTAMGALIGAKHILHNTLDFFDLPSSIYALSVKINVCYSFVKYYLASGDYPLVDVYYSKGKEFIEQTIPQEGTISILRNIFKGGEIPAQRILSVAGAA